MLPAPTLNAHPQRPEAVAFARRPGRYAYVIDCLTGSHPARLNLPQGHHFYGHGCFSADGNHLFTTENDYETARGMIDIWDVTQGYRRVGQFDSGGIGPLEMLLRLDAPGLVAANGDIETHPDSGRAKLNLSSKHPNLSNLSFDGVLQQQMEPPAELHQNSIRHLAMRADGGVGFAMPWQGDLGDDVPIVDMFRPGTEPALLGGDDPRPRNLKGYGGSIALARDGNSLAVSAPRGGVAQILDTATGSPHRKHRLADVCRLAPFASSFVASTGTGAIATLTDTDASRLS